MDPERNVGFASLLSNSAPPNRFHSVLHEGSKQKRRPPMPPPTVSKNPTVTLLNVVVVLEPFKSNTRFASALKPPAGGANETNPGALDAIVGNVNVIV